MEITLDKLAKDVADKALNDIKLDGKTIREWVETIAKQQICGDCISREEAIKTVLPYTSGDLIADDIKKLPPVIPKGVTVTDFADRCRECGAKYGILAKQQICGDMGEVSDGYHTFNQLYYQRAVLFACIVKQNKNKAWKSFKHSDGKYCFDSNGEWFIVGIDTPQGSYTYHYAKEYWDMFDCQELDCGKEWDGHTEEDVTRLLSLEQQPFINKPCVSEGVCREDKMQVLDKIREDIMKLKHDVDIIMYGIAIDDALEIIDKYRTESEE